MMKIKFRERLEVKLTSIFLLIVSMAVIILATTMYRKSYSLFVNNLGSRSVKIAEAAVNKVDIKEFGKLKTSADEKMPYYNKLKQQLEGVKDSSGAKFIYAMRKNESGQYVYVVNSTDSNDGKNSHIGDVENEIDKGYGEVYKGNAYIAEKINVVSEGTLVSSYYPLKESNGEVVGFVGVAYDVTKEHSAFQKFIIELVLITVGILIITGIFGAINSKTMLNPIVKVTELLNKTASLDLTHNSDYESLLKHKGEIGVMVNALFNTREELRLLVTAMTENSKNISMHSGTLSSVSYEMASSVENVSASIENVANGTTAQTVDLLDARNKLGDFGTELSNIVKKIKDIYEETGDIKSMADTSSGDMENVRQNLNNISSSFNNLIAEISSLGKDINKITDITNIIKGIAAQTNLLALNASIEAARAGEAGRGFSVVAGEIRKLAEQAKDSSENINELISNISGNAKIMLNTTEVMDKELINEFSMINNSVDSFKNIIQSIDGIIPKIDEVSIGAISIDNEKDTIIEKIEVVSAASQEISASTEEISATAQQVTAATEEIASSADVLNNMTTEMTELVNNFKL